MLKPKPRNSGTMTEAAFRNWILNILRGKSRMWKPIQEVRKAAQRKYVGDNKRRKWIYECSICHSLVPAEELNIHHIVPVVDIEGFTTYEDYINRLFCEADNLIACCVNCHNHIHENDKSIKKEMRDIKKEKEPAVEKKTKKNVKKT